MDKFPIDRDEWEQIHLSPDQVVSIKQKIHFGLRGASQVRKSSGIRLGSISAGVAGLVVFIGVLLLLGRSWFPLHHQEATSLIHPDYSILQRVPESKVSVVKAAVRQSTIRNLELPTWLPYTVTQANVPNGAVIEHHVTIYLGDSSEVLSIDAEPAGQNWGINISNAQTTHLSDGTKVLYGTNGAVSELAWVKNGVFYVLSASKQGNVPDLSEELLIRVAESFK